MHLYRPRAILLALLILLGLAACKSNSANDPTLMPTAVPPDQITVEPSPLPTDVPTFTPTWTPSPSPTPTFTPSPTPSPTPQPSTLLERAGRAMHNGDYDSAILIFRQLMDAAGTTEVEQKATILGLAEAQLRNDAFAAAESSLLDFLARFADAVETAQATFWLAQARQGQADWLGSIEAFESYLALDPTLTVYVSDLMADSYLALGDDAAAVTAYETALNGAATADKMISIRERLAQAYLAAGQLEAAIAQYDAVVNLTDNSYTLARMDYLAGYALLLNNLPDQAYQRYLHAVQYYPAAYDSYLALIELVDAGVPVDDFQRGLVDYYADQCIPAISAFYRHLEADPYNHPADGHLYVARCYADLGNYPAALSELEVLIDTHPNDPLWDDGWLEKAKIQTTMGAVDTAVLTYLTFVEAYPANELAPIALWRAADLRENAGNWAGARELYLQLAADYPANQDAPEALFRAGLMAYWMQEHQTAAQDWELLVTGYPKSDWTPPALVWLSQILELEQVDSYLALAANLPTDSYYAIRAADIVSGVQPFEPPATIAWPQDDAAGQVEAELWLRSWLDVDAGTNLGVLSIELSGDPRWQRGQLLWDLGLLQEARVELNNLRYAYSDDPLASYQLALAFRDMGLYRSSILAAAALIDLSPAETALDAPVFIGRLAYPVYYQDLVRAAAAEHGLDPLLLFSMIRQESLFESFARSWAAAQGLMQVIPSTGEYIAGQLNWPNYSNQDLFKPYVSVPFGAYYIAQQLGAFDNKVFVALSAYNAGPGNAGHWYDIAPDNPDLYLEIITLSEPRSYIQRIYSHYTFYRVLYGQP